MANQLIARDALGTLTKLGQGGQGIVYQAPKVKTKFAATMVFKEYKPQTRRDVNFQALAAMPTLVEETLSSQDGQGLVSIAAWPCAIVKSDTGPVGFVMPAMPDAFYIDLTTVKGRSRASAEFQHLLNPPEVLSARGVTITDQQRYQLLREVAKSLSFLHRIGVCVGDISPKNVLFSPKPRPAVYFLDCDTMRVNGVSALPQVETPGWEVPSGEQLATIYSDTYKLGLLALRLLVGDQHTRNPQDLTSTTPKPLRQLITDTLTKEPDHRPLPEAWTYLLGNAIDQAPESATGQRVAQRELTPLTYTPEPPPVVRSPADAPKTLRETQSPTPTASNQTAKSILMSSRLKVLGGVAVVAVFGLAIGLVLNNSHSPSPAELMSGTYKLRDLTIGGERTWRITPCGDDCLEVEAGIGSDKSNPYQGTATQTHDGKWLLEAFRDDAISCPGGGYGPAAIAYKWDPSTLRGRQSSARVVQNACGSPTGSSVGDGSDFVLMRE